MSMRDEDNMVRVPKITAVRPARRVIQGVTMTGFS